MVPLCLAEVRSRTPPVIWLVLRSALWETDPIEDSTQLPVSEERISVWIRKWAFPALLCAIAMQQLLAVATLDLTPWKGGGFGMFSSIDTPSARILRVEASVEGRSVRLDLASVQEDPWTERASYFALGKLTENNLRRLARRLAAIEWVPVGVERSMLAAGEVLPSDASVPDLWRSSVLRPRSARDRWLPPGATIRPHRVRAQVWKLKFDPSNRELTFVPAGPVADESGAS